MKVKIEDIRLNPQQDVVPYQTPEQQKEIERIAEQFRKKGQLRPIRLYDDCTIRDGHLRFYAAKKLGWKEIDATIEPLPKEA